MLTVTNCQILNNVALSTDASKFGHGWRHPEPRWHADRHGHHVLGNTGMSAAAPSLPRKPGDGDKQHLRNNNPSGIDIFGGSTTVTSSTFANTGVGILNETGGTLTVTNSTFTGNSIGISVAGNASVTNSTITGNSTGIVDADRPRYPKRLTMTNSILSGNSSDDWYGNAA